jgi:uncharacterized protein YggE
MFGQYSITTPYGMSVFGSATLRVEPDIAVISFAVSEVKSHPKEAFAAVRATSRKVQTFLSGVNAQGAGSSRISLHEEYEHKNNTQKFVGYRATVEFRVVLNDLTRLEDVLAGLVDVGVGGIHGVSFQTSRLKELRAEARRQAVLAAREKADNYCDAAGVALGDVIHIEDVNPDQLQRNQGHMRAQAAQDDDGEARAFDPSSIVISGAVMIAYKLRSAGA